MSRGFVFFGVGLVVWVVGVVVIRLLHPFMFGDFALHALMFVIAFVTVPITLLPIAKLMKIPKHQLLVPTVIMALPAMLLDSLSVTFDAAGLTNIYTDTPTAGAYTGGLLLFAFWSFLLVALYWHKAEQK